MRRIFTQRRVWDDASFHLTVCFSTIAVIGVVFAMQAHEAAQKKPEPCKTVYRQGNMTNVAEGVTWREPSGMLVCEVKKP